jgi:hypothetical protein
MEKTMNTMKSIKISTLFLAISIFFNSTAFGIEAALNWDEYHFLKTPKPISNYSTHFPSNYSVEQNISLKNENNINKYSANRNDNMLPDGGPDQPEVKSFSPIGTSDMVDPFSGDFSYNIPLLDVDGYPINIAYSAGVTMDQEATWVGLGWNLNPGVISRSMRGLPDDFNGIDEVKKEFNLKDNFTVGGSFGVDFELFGFDIKKFNLFSSGTAKLALSLGIDYNNYTGFSSSLSVTPSIKLAGANGLKGTAGLGLSGSSSGGASLSPTVGISKGDENSKSIKSLNIGSSLNSREGFSNISISYKRTDNKQKDFKKDDKTTTVKYQSTGLSMSSSYNFSQSTYTPTLSMPFKSNGKTFNYKFGLDALGSDGHVNLSGFYNYQSLKYKEKKSKAYGYFNLEKGQHNSDGLLDFNRENDGAFTKNTPALAIPNLTYDLFSVSGHGVSGSYRAVRKDIGYVFDQAMNNTSENGSIGLETGIGATYKGGLDLTESFSNSFSGKWNDMSNFAKNVYAFRDKNYYFREANEKAVDADPEHFNKIGGSNAVRFDVKSSQTVSNVLDDGNGNFYNNSDVIKKGTDHRNQVLYSLTNGELKQNSGIESLHPQSYAWSSSNLDHHIGQFTVLNVEGSRYVYGIGAYSHYQKDVSFAASSKETGSPLPVNYTNGLVQYAPNDDNTINNKRGFDNSFNSLETPAFIHTYLLTTVLNADYIDADNIQGPSQGDLGGYLKFDYTKVDNYNWRNPIEKNKATFDEGMNADLMDDKGHYIAGKKELWYLSKIISKNHVAVFYTSKRLDAISVNSDDNGGINTNSAAPAMMKLDSIQLFSIADFQNSNLANPIKTVHFEYDYSLCNQYSGHINNLGKLTLKKIYFTYQKSNKGKYSPYVFNYGQRFIETIASNGDRSYQVAEIINPNYSMKNIDRWNNYKTQATISASNFSIASEPLRSSDFPYVALNESETNKNSIAWNLTTIFLPSGGKIEVDYESDSYAYVQNKRANQMFKIVAAEGPAFQLFQNGKVNLTSDDNLNSTIYVELLPDPTSPSGYNENLKDYVKFGQQIYFRALMHFGNNRYDFVPGYADVSDDPQHLAIVNLNGTKVLKMKLVGARLSDSGSSIYNPIAVAAIQFARLNLSSVIPPSSSNSINENLSILALIESLKGAATGLLEFFTGPNHNLRNDNIGCELVLNHSWVRLQNPSKNKLGGGHRVRNIRMYDSWDIMTANKMPATFYGQRYDYRLSDGTSSGVAAYEPAIGGDENPWKQPIAYNKEILLAPDTRNFQTTPFGEQFFPSARVGYSQVTIEDVTKFGGSTTGKIVQEFYTAKNFPTIVKRTEVDKERLKLPVFAFFFSLMIDEMAASQGFVVENNDMHGKEKAKTIYAKGQNSPVSKVEYFYQSKPLNGSINTGNNNIDQVLQLTNDVKTINKDGSVGQSTIGLVYDAVADFRKSTSKSISGTVETNINATAPFIILPALNFSGSYSSSEFRSATFTKVIDRFGLLSKTVATDLGSTVETSNLAYDSETGAVLLTETTTNFNDKLYNFTYPAHWIYDQMGQAYKNISLKVDNLNFYAGGTNQVTNAQFSEGDELAVYTGYGVFATKAWVVEASPAGIKVLTKNGTPLFGVEVSIKVLRSGRRNMQTTSIGSVVLKENPINNLKGNIFHNVLQASANEYSNDWRTFCECFLSQNSTTNPYVLGTRGIWRPKAAYVHLSGRNQTFENGNSNIREDGHFTSFNPFYKNINGKWTIDRKNWTYTSSVVEFSPNGQALETIDALNRYSSSMFGYNQTLASAVATNTRYRQLGFDGFEDYFFTNCSDNHFKITDNTKISTQASHSGKYSLYVKKNQNVVFSKEISTLCEDNNCAITVSNTFNSTSNTRTIIPSGGTAPYSFDYQQLSGQVSTELTPNGSGLILTYLTNVLFTKTSITVIDASGCQLVIEL